MCKRWNNLLNINSSLVWKCVDFGYRRKITSEVLDSYVYPGSTRVVIDECVYLNWKELHSILKKCERLEVLSLAWIGYSDRVHLDLTELRISNVRYLNLSHCFLADDDKQFEEIASQCKHLSVLILQNSSGVSREAYNSSSFKDHRKLELINVAYVTEALEVLTIRSILQYNYSKVKVDIRGHHLTDEDFDTIESADSNALARIIDIEDYRHLLF